MNPNASLKYRLPLCMNRRKEYFVTFKKNGKNFDKNLEGKMVGVIQVSAASLQRPCENLPVTPPTSVGG